MKFSKTASLLSVILVSQITLGSSIASAAEITEAEYTSAVKQLDEVEAEADEILKQDPDAVKVKGPSCAKLYQAKLAKKARRKQKVDKVLEKATLGGAIGSVGVFFFAGLTGNLPLLAGSFVAWWANALPNIYMQDHDVKSPKFKETLNIMHGASTRAYKEFSADVKKKVSTATDEDISSAVKFGFESGGFCRGEKKNPMSKNKMLKFVVDHLKETKK